MRINQLAHFKSTSVQAYHTHVEPQMFAKSYSDSWREQSK